MNTDLLTTAIQSARAAGQILVERLPNPRQVHIKGLRDIVTDADLAAEQAIVQTIRERFPDHALLTEENGASDGNAPYVWVVDPLDGTTNYNRRLPCFSVSIGLLHQEQLTLGVVYDPLREHLFTAVRGRGATLNGAPLHVSAVDRIQNAVVGMDWAHAQAARDDILARVNRVAPHCGALRGMGSATLGLCYVAAGRYDAYFHVSLKPWDLAAALLLVQEAGGRVTDLEGRPWRAWEGRVLVSNGHVHRDLLGLMA